MVNTSFLGASGWVSFESNGDRAGLYDLKQLSSQAEWIKRGSVSKSEVSLDQALMFHGGSTRIPGQDEGEDQLLGVKITGIAVGIGSVAAALVYYGFKKKTDFHQHPLIKALLSSTMAIIFGICLDVADIVSDTWGFVTVLASDESTSLVLVYAAILTLSVVQVILSLYIQIRHARSNCSSAKEGKRQQADSFSLEATMLKEENMRMWAGLLGVVCEDIPCLVVNIYIIFNYGGEVPKIFLISTWLSCCSLGFALPSICKIKENRKAASSLRKLSLAGTAEPERKSKKIDECFIEGTNQDTVIKDSEKVEEDERLISEQL